MEKIKIYGLLGETEVEPKPIPVPPGITAKQAIQDLRYLLDLPLESVDSIDSITEENQNDR